MSPGPRASDSERLLHFATELSSRLGGAVKDMIPPEAQHHLLNAQREMLTALFLIYEHQAGGRRPPEMASPRPRRRTARKPAGGGRRLNKIDIE
jgi:hypothetical protein